MIKRLLLSTILFITFNQTFGINCLPEWKYYRTVKVNNTNTSSYTDLQVKITVNTQALVSTGKMNIAGNDIRFTDSLCNPLNYWIDSNMNTAATVIWVKLKDIPASGTRTIYMWYGNYCATAAQNGDSTFILFDDFNGGALNTGKWDVYRNSVANGSNVVSGGNLTLTSTGGWDINLRSVASFPGPLAFESKIKSYTGINANLALLNNATFNGVAISRDGFNNFQLGNATTNSVHWTVTPNTSSAVPFTSGVWGIKWFNTNNAVAVTSIGSNITTATTTAMSANLHAGFGLYEFGNGTMVMDWVRLRKAIPVDASTNVNAENNNSLRVSFSPTTICPGSSINMSYSKNGIFFNSGNTFKIEISDASGSFGSPFTLATVNDTVLNGNTVEIPKNLAPGNGYKIRVTSTSPAYNCFVSDLSLIVNPKPNISFNVLQDSQCYKYNRYDFFSTSTISAGTIDSFIWNFDDGSKYDTLTTNFVSHHFAPFYPYYYPKLTAISNLGCHDSASFRINILESPNIMTQFNDTIQCLRGNFFIIQNVTPTFSGVIVSNSFDPGDGSGVLNNIDSFTHRYSTNGIYQVRQIATHSSGCIDTNYLGCLVNEHPVAKINTNDTDQCLTGNSFIFEAQSTINNGLPLINYWDMGNSDVRDMQDSVHYNYPSAANRNVQLITISDDGLDGCADTTIQPILVNPMPKANLSTVDNDQCFNYNKFEFIAKSTIAYGTISHDWNFGDLATLNNKDTATHSYGSDGNYTIRMYATSNKGCQDSTNTSVVIRPTPVPAFTVNANTQCFKYHQLKALSQSTINSGTFTKLWLLSDGNDYTNVDSIAHAFLTEGDYKLDLILNSNYNCKDTISDSVHILPMPISDFAVNDADQCFEGNSFTFTDNSTFPSGTITGNKWLFDDGAIATNLPSVQHQYAAENGYVPGLIVYGDNSCYDTSFMDIKVYPHPGSDFFINDTGQCVNNNSFFFNNNTFISEGTFINRWNYGDGSANVDALHGSKKYTKDGTFYVRVISFSDQGCTDTMIKTVTVFPKSVTNFTIDNPQQCVAGNNFNFASTTTLKRGTFTTNWQFGDGNSLNNSLTASHSYFGVQTYNVRLISTTNEGCLDTSNKTVKTLAMPVANFTTNYNQHCLTGNQFDFNSTSTVSGGALMTHNWYFGDNDSSINSTFAQHTYQTDGSFTVRMISSTNIGQCKDTMDKVMSVFPMPIATFIVDKDKQCFLNNVFNFNSSSTVSSGTIDLFDWKMGDNTTSSISSPVKSYTKVDSFRVRLMVTTDKGCTDSFASKVYVYPMPVAAFTLNRKSSCLKNNLFAITNKSSISNAGTIALYQYYYGNNDSSLLKDPAPYTYPASGKYTIMQRVTSDKGCWDTATAEVDINPNPNLAFTVDSVCFKDSSIFVNNSTISTGTIDQWKWIFGDGKTSTLQSPKHKYKSVGVYDITLIAVTNNLCTDTLKKPGAAKVNANPKAGFYYTKQRSWENEVDIQYTDTSLGAQSWKWDFASMGTSADQNPKLYYVDTLTQLTRLIVTNSVGCNDTTTKLLFIAPDVVYYMPSAFTPNDDNINETFKPIGLSYAINYKFIIFNRWGEILFKTDNPQLGWDGKFDGELVEQDLYFYRLEFVGVDELRHEEKGNIMILR